MDKSFLFFSFSIAEKETKKLDKNMLPRTGQGWPAFLSGPTHIDNGIIEKRLLDGLIVG